MAGVADTWTASDAGIEGRSIRMVTLTFAPRISLVFLRLPDGGADGGGFPRYRCQNLPKLWSGSIDQIQAIDGSQTYTKSTLISTLTELISDYAPSLVRTHDPDVANWDHPDVANWDHPDHHSVGSFVMAANAGVGQPSALTTYRGYSVSDYPPNVSGAELAGKREAMRTYAAYDPMMWQFEWADDLQYVIKTLPGQAVAPPTAGGG